MALTIAIHASPAAAQAVWDARDLGGAGAEFRLGNGEGAASILACQLAGFSAGIEFSEPLEATGGVAVRPDGSQPDAAALELLLEVRSGKAKRAGRLARPALGSRDADDSRA